jgi:uncharacterized protein YfaT (DUF1175 family)
MKINQATVLYKLEDGTELKVPANELIPHNGLWLVGNGYKDSFITWNQKYISNFLHLQREAKKNEENLSLLVTGLSSTFKIAIENLNKLDGTVVEVYDDDN